MKLVTLALSVALAGLLGGAAFAEEHVVKMLNRGEAGTMVFEPALVRAQVGDTVRYLPVDKGHNAETIKGMIPEGAPMTVGKLNEETVIELTEAGVYGIRCKPHYGLGMVGLIVAGEAVNLEAAEAVKTPGKARKKFAAMFEEIKAN